MQVPVGNAQIVKIHPGFSLVQVPHLHIHDVKGPFALRSSFI